MKSYARIGVLLATVAGLLLAAWIFGATGIDGILPIARRLGIGGLSVYVLYSLGVFVILGAAWLAAAPGTDRDRLGAFVWGRLIREASADLLPFSQIGAIVIATRTLTSTEIESTRVYASLIVDLTTEIASQLVFTLIGIALLVFTIVDGSGAPPLRLQMGIGCVGLMVVLTLLLLAQRWLIPLAGRVAQHVLPGSLVVTQDIASRLRATYAARGRVASAFVLNLTAWSASAFGAWIVLRLMDVDVSVTAVIALESLIFLVRSVAFAVPGGIGVQEIGYAVVAPWLGLSPESALALAKRVRDLAIGLPTLLVWQLAEARAMLPFAKKR